MKKRLVVVWLLGISFLVQGNQPGRVRGSRYPDGVDGRMVNAVVGAGSAALGWMFWRGVNAIEQVACQLRNEQNRAQEDCSRSVTLTETAFAGAVLVGGLTICTCVCAYNTYRLTKNFGNTQNQTKKL